MWGVRRRAFSTLWQFLLFVRLCGLLGLGSGAGVVVLGSPPLAVVGCVVWCTRLSWRMRVVMTVPFCLGGCGRVDFLHVFVCLCLCLWRLFSCVRAFSPVAVFSVRCVAWRMGVSFRGRVPGEGECIPTICAITVPVYMFAPVCTYLHVRGVVSMFCMHACWNECKLVLLLTLTRTHTRTRTCLSLSLSLLVFLYLCSYMCTYR